MELQKLETKPDEIQVTGHFNPNGKEGRQWVKLIYNYEGSLTAIGMWLTARVFEIEEAGMYVTNINFGSLTGIRPSNSPPDDFKNKDKWRAGYIEFSVVDQKSADEEAAMWLAAARNLIKGVK